MRSDNCIADFSERCFDIFLVATTISLKLIPFRFSKITDQKIAEAIWIACSAGIACSDCRKLKPLKPYFRHMLFLE